MSDLIDRLKDGLIEHPKRWSGDTHSDMGGSVDYEATDRLMAEAAARIADLERQLAEARKVKPLEWGPHPFGQSTVEECAIAEAPFNHRYQAQRDPWAPTYMAYLYPRLPITDSTLWWESKGHADIEAAKAAAQADYAARILSALKGTP